MDFNVSAKNNKAFSLLELTIVIIIMTVLLTYAVPTAYRSYLVKAGTKTALEVQGIQSAAKIYYLKNGSWPSSINTAPGDLESSGYLPASWNAINPFNKSYRTSSVGTVFTVATIVADGAQNFVASNLHSSHVSGATITSTINAPGGITAPPLYVVTGTTSNGGTIPLAAGYTDSQCQWFVAGSTDETYDTQ